MMRFRPARGPVTGARAVAEPQHLTGPHSGADRQQQPGLHIKLENRVLAANVAAHHDHVVTARGKASRKCREHVVGFVAGQ